VLVQLRSSQRFAPPASTWALTGLTLFALLGAGCMRPSASASSVPTNPAPVAAPSSLDTSALVVTDGRVVGTVNAVAGTRVGLADGTQFELSPGSRIIQSRPGTVSDLHAGQFVAITASRQADESLLAIRVNVFAEASRGQGEGQRPMATGNVMTNATIDGTIGDLVGGEFEVAFPDGRDRVRLAPDVEIEVRSDGEISDVQPGAEVTAVINDGFAQSVSIQAAR
jgi:hypothetical protein